MRAGAREEIVIDRKVPECPLCGAAGPTPLGAWDAREYWSCPRCQLAFVPERYWPTPEAELARYNLHRNGPEDAGYIALLERLARPLAERLPPGAHGLDYGCGPVPVLGRLLQARGFAALPFDPFYFPKFLEGPFDFIASSETFEHFRRPGEEMVRLRGVASSRRAARHHDRLLGRGNVCPELALPPGLHPPVFLPERIHGMDWPELWIRDHLVRRRAGHHPPADLNSEWRLWGICGILAP